MLKNIFLICSVIISANGKGMLNVMSSQKEFNVVKPKVLKSLKRSAAIGGAIGGSVPVIKEIFSFPDEIKTVKRRVYSENVNVNGDVWSYSELIRNIENEVISNVCIDQDGRYALIRENIKSDVDDKVHYVTTIPVHMTELIKMLLDADINIDIIM